MPVDLYEVAGLPEFGHDHPLSCLIVRQRQVFHVEHFCEFSQGAFRIGNMFRMEHFSHCPEPVSGGRPLDVITWAFGRSS